MSWRDKRNTGIALLLVGVAFVGFALLFSLVLPRALQKRIADEMCVSSKEDAYYDQWVSHFMISIVGHEKGTGTEMPPAIVSGIGIGDALISYWPIFSLSQITVPEVLVKVNSAQFPSRL